MSGPLRVRIERLEHARDLPLPRPASAGSAGIDLRAAVAGDLQLEPGARARVPTGLVLALPAGYEGQVRPRSGLAIEQGLTVLNAPGTIDADYRGELAVLLVNLGQRPVSIRRGDRIAQLIVAPIVALEWQEETGLLEDGDSPRASRRGGAGFGSTGVD